MRDVAVVSFQRKIGNAEGLDEVEMLAPTIAGALASAGLARRDVGFTVSGSCDYLGGRPFSFVTVLDAVGVAAGEIHRATPIGHAALRGVAAGAVGLLAAIVLRTGRQQFVEVVPFVLMAVTFVAMSVVRLPLFVILLTLVPIAIFIYRPRASTNRV